MKNLISMVEFVLQEGRTPTPEQEYFLVSRYADFLSQKLSIEMFIPCKLVDGVWVVLQKPKDYVFFTLGIDPTDDQSEECKEAKERCIFEGFIYQEAKKEGHYSILRFNDIVLYPKLWRNETVENLVKYNLQLTASAQKQIEG